MAEAKQDSTVLDPWKELRKPFSKEAVGLLPKPYKADSPKGTCPDCGKYHGLPAVHLDYVGHAAVTDRLLSVDPLWTWEPLATNESGLPAYDNAGGLWIKLTVNGVTRLGYGDGKDPKERIGDALRNAAMRFGVALDLWSKEELESNLADPSMKNEKPSASPAPQSAKPEATTAVPDEDRYVTSGQAALILARARDASGLVDKVEIMDWFIAEFGISAAEVKRGELQDILQILTDRIAMNAAGNAA